jgi:hypothetical protein
MSGRLAAMLADGDVRVDLTPEPGEPALPGLDGTEQNRGLIPHVPRNRVAPHFPGRDGALGDGTNQLLVIPLTTSVGFSGHETARAAVPFSTLRLWLPPREFAAMLEARLTDPGLTHLAFAIRSDLPLHPREWEWFQANLRHLCAHPLATDLSWVSASHARELLLPRATPVAEAAGWPDDHAAAAALKVLAASLSSGVRETEQELTHARARHATDMEALRSSLRAAQAQSADLGQRLAGSEKERRRLEADLSKVRATTWWRLHDRLLPMLRPLVGIKVR